MAGVNRRPTGRTGQINRFARKQGQPCSRCCSRSADGERSGRSTSADVDHAGIRRRSTMHVNRPEVCDLNRAAVDVEVAIQRAPRAGDLEDARASLRQAMIHAGRPAGGGHVAGDRGITIAGNGHRSAGRVRIAPEGTGESQSAAIEIVREI